MKAAHKQRPAGSRQTWGAPQQTARVAPKCQKAWEVTQTRTSIAELHLWRKVHRAVWKKRSRKETFEDNRTKPISTRSRWWNRWLSSVDCLTCIVPHCAVSDKCTIISQPNSQIAAVTHAGRAGIQVGAKWEGLFFSAKDQQVWKGRDAKQKGTKLEENSFCLKLLSVRLKKSKTCLKQREIKEAFFRFQSKPFVQFNLFSLVPPFASFLHQSQQNGSSRRDSSLGFEITKETKIKAI